MHQRDGRPKLSPYDVVGRHAFWLPTFSTTARVDDNKRREGELQRPSKAV
jgi:hypothetical protein